jgi:hypothetical protein
MRNISFSATKKQIQEQTKTVTRRVGWWFLKPGDRLCGIEKAQGLKKGEKIKRISPIEIVSVKSEMIYDLLDNPEYFKEEMIKEGFPGMSVEEFFKLFMKLNDFDYTEEPYNRIEFRYICPKCGYPTFKADIDEGIKSLCYNDNCKFVKPLTSGERGEP